MGFVFQEMGRLPLETGEPEEVISSECEWKNNLKNRRYRSGTEAMACLDGLSSFM